MSRQQIPAAVQRRIRIVAGNRYGYCRSPQRLLPWELAMEHIVPAAHGGTHAEENLWLSCRACNSFKGTATHGRDPVTNRRVRLFNPRRQKWSRHFMWSPDGIQIIGLTASGRATIIGLKLNNIFALTARREWVAAGWHPPIDKN